MKNIFCFISLFLISICLQNTVAAAEDSTKTIFGFTKTQVESIKKIAHDYVVNNPEVLVEAGKKLEQLKEKTLIEQIKTNIPKYKRQIFATSIPGRVVLGNPKGKIIITEFTQYQCSHCKQVSPIIDKLLKTNPEIQLVIVYWPFFGDNATYTAKAILAAKNQNKFEELNKALLTEESITKDKVDTIVKSIKTIDSKKLYADMDSKKIEKGLKDNFILAQKLNIIGTPTFIFTNREMTKFSLVPGQGPNFEADLTKSLSEVQ